MFDHQLQRDVLAIATDDGRMVGSCGHERARTYLLGRMHDIGLSPFRGNTLDLPYTAPGLSPGVEFHNLIGVVHGDERERRLHAPVLVGAHYDSVIDAPCADDNAAAVAIALKVGERLVESPTKRDVVIAIFDAEEPPYYLDESMGSVRFFHDQRDGVTFHCAIIMDLCGHDVPSPVDIPGASLLVPAIPRLLFVMGSESHPELPSVVRSASRGDGKLPVITALNEYVGDLSDHHVFRVNDVPYLFLSCGRWEYYHMPTDTPDKLNFRKMARIAAFIERSVRELDGVMTGTAKPHDTTEFDIEMFKRALGPIGTTIAMKAVGLRELRSREDFDAIAYGLMSTGLV